MRIIELEFSTNITFSKWHEMNSEEDIVVNGGFPGVYLIARKERSSVGHSAAKKTDPEIIYIGSAINGVRGRLRSVLKNLVLNSDDKHAGCKKIEAEFGPVKNWGRHGLYFAFYIGDSFDRNHRRDKSFEDFLIEGKILYLERHCMAYFFKKHGTLPLGNSVGNRSRNRRSA